MRRRLYERREITEVLPVGTWSEFLSNCDVFNWEWYRIPYRDVVAKVDTKDGTYYIVEVDVEDDEDFFALPMDEWDWEFDEPPEKVFPKLEGGRWKDVKAIVWWPLPWGITDRNRGFFGYVILGPEEEDATTYNPLNGRIFATVKEALNYLREKLRSRGSRIKRVKEY